MNNLHSPCIGCLCPGPPVCSPGKCKHIKDWFDRQDGITRHYHTVTITAKEVQEAMEFHRRQVQDLGVNPDDQVTEVLYKLLEITTNEVSHKLEVDVETIG